jgi:two-component system sensor histidine kinase FlrB
MLPSSHPFPGNQVSRKPLHDPRILADAFSEFIAASAQLEASYRELQQRVAHLSVELAERNAALTRSLAENDRMRGHLQQVIDSMPCGVLVMDAVETVVMINPEGRRLLGLAGSGTMNLAELSRTSRLDLKAIAAVCDPGQEYETEVDTESGRRWLAIGRHDLSSASAQVSPDAPLRRIWILRDITAQRRAEQEREAARRATTLAEISTILAHEIRNPLASMELFAGLLAEGGPETGRWIGHLQAGIRTLTGTVNNVLSMNSQAAPRLTALNLNACLRNGVEFVQPIAEEAGIRLTFSESREALHIRGNEDAVRQILLNLICNAIRHTPAGGQVSVSAREARTSGRRSILVEVGDSGCGIPEEQIGRLFEAGFSGTGETPGLGLAVCKRLMEQHGGAIRASSRPGLGSNFQLEFPGI